MNSYAREVARIKALPVHDLSMVKDQWRTTDAHFFGIETLLPVEEGALRSEFVIDLFTDGQNSKCPDYYTAEENALKQNWADDMEFLTPAGVTGYAFGNPPYSNITLDDGGDTITGMKPIIEKCIEQRNKGARIALLIKAATSETWWPENKADRTIFVKGRIAYERPLWLNLENKIAKHSAFFGCAVLIFNQRLPVDGMPMYIHKKELARLGLPKAKALAKERLQFIENFEL